MEFTFSTKIEAARQLHVLTLYMRDNESFFTFTIKVAHHS